MDGRCNNAAECGDANQEACYANNQDDPTKADRVCNEGAELFNIDQCKDDMCGAVWQNSCDTTEGTALCTCIQMLPYITINHSRSFSISDTTQSTKKNTGIAHYPKKRKHRHGFSAAY